MTKPLEVATIARCSYYDPDYFNDFGGKELSTSEISIYKNEDVISEIYYILTRSYDGKITNNITLTKHQAKTLIECMSKELA